MHARLLTIRQRSSNNTTEIDFVSDFILLTIGRQTLTAKCLPNFIQPNMILLGCGLVLPFYKCLEKNTATKKVKKWADYTRNGFKNFIDN